MMKTDFKKEGGTLRNLSLAGLVKKWNQRICRNWLKVKRIAVK
jgi:hypothetical protein